MKKKKMTILEEWNSLTPEEQEARSQKETEAIIKAWLNSGPVATNETKPELTDEDFEF